MLSHNLFDHNTSLDAKRYVQTIMNYLDNNRGKDQLNAISYFVLSLVDVNGIRMVEYEFFHNFIPTFRACLY